MAATTSTSPNGSFVDALLDRVEVDDDRLAISKIVAFRRAALMLMSTEFIAAFPRLDHLPDFPIYVSSTLALAMCAAACWRPRWEVGATRAAVFFYAVLLWLGFPLVANHHYLMLVSISLLAILDGDVPRERRLLLATLKWMILIGIFYAGVQKVLYGLYFHGEALAYFILRTQRFQEFFGWVLPAAEMARITSIDLVRDGDSFRSHSVPLLLLSNASYLGELVFPVLVLLGRFRPVVLGGGLVYFAAIEAGAREMIFAGIIVNFFALFTARDRTRALVLGSFALCAYLIGVGYGWFPDWMYL